MSPFRTTWRWLRSLARRQAVKLEIDEELRFHVEQRTADNIVGGMSPTEAAREARKVFGNAQRIREECRDARGASFGETTFQDIRFGLRMLGKNPGFTTVSVLSLAMGIAVNVAVFSCLDALLFRPPPGAKDPHRWFTCMRWAGAFPTPSSSSCEITAPWFQPSRLRPRAGMACAWSIHPLNRVPTAPQDTAKSNTRV